MNKPTIAVLGASGLIGEDLASFLLRGGFSVVPIARRFSLAQKSIFGVEAVERPIVALDAEELADIFTVNKVDIVVNCMGVLQDGPRGTTAAVHRAFVERLVTVLSRTAGPPLLIHLSIPGHSKDDRTSFSRTKREAERAIAAGSVPFIILRLGFVVASSAYGGGALLRALAVLPLNLAVREASNTFAATDLRDIARTIGFVARHWSDGKRDWNMVWDVMAREPSTVGDVIDAFRYHLGGPKSRMTLPSWLMTLGARAGDLIAHLGWSPPIRSTALAEMRRGVAGNPEPWIAATGIKPASLAVAVQRLSANVQEKWFARLYLAKALVLFSLVVFWALSGSVAFSAATVILTSHGFSPPLAKVITVAGGVVDILVGLAIAVRKTCHTGLLAGICVSLFYMVSAAVLAPELWFELFGALVKTGPAIVLMLVALAILKDR
jgi:nucleoside-diphosphate-sugar epimerase